MTPAHLETIMRELEVDAFGLSRLTWRTPSTVYKWLRGDHPVPAVVAVRLEEELRLTFTLRELARDR
jgi:hypothetical protein